MRKLRKIILVVSALLLVLTAVTGCVKIKKDNENGDDRLFVVCTAFAQYDFIRNIAGDSVRLELLVPAGTDTHNFGLKDISISKLDRLNDADLLVYVGGESDEKLVSDLKTALKGNTRFVSLLSLVEKPLVAAEGHDHDDGHDHTNEYDEHVWTCPKRAMEIVEKLCAVLTDLRPEEGERYKSGASLYTEKLQELDADFAKLNNTRTYDTLIFADRYPFRYLCHDYGIQAEAAFSGCSSEVEPSLAVLDALYEKARELGLPAILYMEGSNAKYAESIAEKIGGRALMLHSCHILTAEEMESENYLSLMEKNLAVLKIALGAQ